MKLRSNFAKKILSAILSLTVVTSASLPFSLTAFADSGGATSAGSSAGGAGKYALDEGEDVIKITASMIDDGSTVNDMANLNKRYGALMAYPIYMRTGLMSGHVKHSASYKTDITQSISNLRSEVNNWSANVDFRKARQLELVNGTTSEAGGVVRYVASGKSATIYLEDAAKAVQYALNEKRYLYGFLADPGIEISNNRAENAIRPFVVGRKN